MVDTKIIVVKIIHRQTERDRELGGDTELINSLKDTQGLTIIILVRQRAAQCRMCKYYTGSISYMGVNLHNLGFGPKAQSICC